MKLCHQEKAMTLIEILVVVAIFSIIIVSYLAFFTDALRHTRRIDDRRFAVQKAIAMMEEIRAFVESGAETQIDLLDDFDDADHFNPMLTTEKGLRSPDDPLSGNFHLGASTVGEKGQPQGGWRYYRKIRVETLREEESKDLRQVRISVYQSADGAPGGEVRADISGIFRTMAAPQPPTQVMDVYAIAIENIPGWWINLSTLRPVVENAFSDLESSNPGLKFRVHWITRSGYGRDPFYSPQINDEKLAQDGIDQVYFYPGRINRQGFRYYSPEIMRGRFTIDRHYDQLQFDEEEAPYALADSFNAALRAPDEARLYQKRFASEMDLEPSYRMFLDEMISTPEKYRNALVLNLHGELLPLPPVRNYSDAAKDTEKYPGARVVTHPEKLFVENYEAVKLRVYAYVSNPDGAPANLTLKDPVSLFFPGVNSLGPIVVQKIENGKMLTLNTEDIGERYADGVLLNLKDVPLRQPNAERLYGLEYVPCPVEAESDFSRNLLSSGKGPKNTARFLITLPSGVLPKDQVLTIETRLGKNNISTGKPGNRPENLSRSFVWIGKPPPFSEKYQFQGDPRHMPYADVKKAHGYNWFFKKIDPDSGYEGFDLTQDGWSEEFVDVDVPRYYEWVREALFRSKSVFSTMTGFSFYYIGLGGEIGSDRPNGFPDGLPVAGRAYGEMGTTMVRAMTEGMHNVKSAKGDWFAIPWLGELYPDSQERNWHRRGNLPAGKMGGEFYRAPWSEMPAAGKLQDRRRRTNVWGSAAFFNAVGDSAGPFNHIFSAKNVAKVTRDGSGLEQTFNFPIQDELKAIRPFTLDAGQNFPAEWNADFYKSHRNHMDLLKVFYGATDPRDAHSSALMHIRGSAPQEGAYVAINGLSPAGETGTAYIGRYALLTLLQGFLSGGAHPNPDYRISQLPLIRIVAPRDSADVENSDTLEIKWERRWQRWDFQAYTEETEEDHRERETLMYVMKYSPDEGKTWFLMHNDEPTHLGVYPKAEDVISDPSYVWDIHKKKGNFVICVEAFRKEIPLHYAYHQIVVSISR